METLYAENHLSTMTIKELRLLLVLGYNCGLNNKTLQLINTVIKQKENK